MPYTIEILSVGGDNYSDIRLALNALNASQDEFNYVTPPARLSEEGFPFKRKEYLSTDVFAFLRDYRAKAKGDRRYLIAIVSSALRSTEYRNIFGSHEALEGLAVFTMKDHERFVPSRQAFIRYYLIRYALSFIAPDLETHADT